MKITRRIFLFFLLLAPLFFSVAAGSADEPGVNSKYLVFVGTYTTKTNSKGIYKLQFDTVTGKLSELGVAAETPDPSWVAVHPSGKFLYAANEAGKAGAVSAFAIDKKSGKLALLNQIPSLGGDPCYLSFDKTGKYVFVANYTSGTIPFFRFWRMADWENTPPWLKTRVQRVRTKGARKCRTPTGLNRMRITAGFTLRI